MKISKLFHWLYALLMLLPAFFVGGRMAYTIFNKNAKDSYSGTNQNTEETNFIRSVNEISPNEEYHFINSFLPSNASSSLGSGQFQINVLESNISELLDTYLLQINVYNNSRSLYYIFYDINGVQLLNTNSNTNLSLKLVFLSDMTLPAFNNLNYMLANTNSLYTIDYFVNNQLDNAFDYSMSQLNELPLFSWAKDSFIVEPFQYITGLFGVPSDSPISTLLSYWCAISIIWLVFDLLMYVPLLAHRWIDKGVLE